MCNEGAAFTVGFVTGVVFLMFIIWLADGFPSDVFPRGYEAGQVDAINGKLCYELKKQEDNTTKWTEIDPCADHTEN